MTHSGSNIAVVAAVIGNLIIAIIKFLAAAITGSSAMISEGIDRRYGKRVPRAAGIRGETRRLQIDSNLFARSCKGTV